MNSHAPAPPSKPIYTAPVPLTWIDPDGDDEVDEALVDDEEDDLSTVEL